MTTKQKTSDLISDALTARIIQGSLGPGEKLRQEHIAREFAASHVPVREALLRLEAQGLAVSRPRQGVRVAPLDRGSILELRVMRTALEPVALTHSVPRLTSAQIELAEQARMECDAAQTVVAWEEANRAFHMATIAACDMPRLIGEVHHLQLLYARHFLSAHAQRWRQREDSDHAAIMSAIRNRNASLAVTVLNRHLARLV